MRYWLFYIMPDVPKSWGAMVRHGIAAQDYAASASRVKSNTDALMKLGPKHKVLAAFGRHRFLGYGTLVSGFNRERYRKPLKNETGFDFPERFDCEWVSIPFDGEPRSINCHELKAKDFQIDLKRGFCVAGTDRRTFLRIKGLIDEAISETQRSDMDAIQGKKEGGATTQLVKHIRRERANRDAAIIIHGTKCMVCKFDFQQRYGKHGAGFIEAHHLRSLDRPTQIDPGRDMAVLCSNCHRMVHHKRGRALTLGELRHIVQGARKNRGGASRP